MSRRLGMGRITAEVVAGSTRITAMSHSAPARLFPVQAVGTERTGSTGFILGGFGGGLLGGDRVDLRLRVGSDATLVGWTQGTTKVYQAKKDLLPAEQVLEAVVEPGALLVLGPDPVMPFADARYMQHQRFELEGDASVVVVDGVSCGRAAQGERWRFQSFSSTNEFYSSRSPRLQQDDIPTDATHETQSSDSRLFLSDALVLDAAERGDSNWSMDFAGLKRDSFASIVAVGPRAASVGTEIRRLAAAVAVRGGARVSEAVRLGEDESLEYPLPSLGGSVCMGVSQGIPGGRHDVTVCRIVAELPEDVTRLVARCMTPLTSSLGAEALPYSGRVHASTLKAALPSNGAFLKHSSSEGPSSETSESVGQLSVASASELAHPSYSRHHLDARQLWTLLQLADPTLPTNGFAHSGGLEAATHALFFGAMSQKRPRAGQRWAVPDAVMGEYFAAAAGASARLYVPFAIAVHRCVSTTMQKEVGAVCLRGLESDWICLNERLAALLATVAPAHRASSVQGSALLEVARTWLRASAAPGSRMVLALQVVEALRAVPPPTGVHFACTMGLVGAALELPQDVMLDALAYASMRGLVSASVRLSLMGPQQAVGFQATVGQMWAKAFAAAADIDVTRAATTAPLLDAVHGLHDLLEARLFQT